MRMTWVAVLTAALLLAIPAQGAKAPVDIAGTGWFGAVSELISVKKLGKDSGIVGLGVLFFDTTWEALDGEGYETSGTYAVSGTKVVGAYDAPGIAVMEKAIKDWIEEYVPDPVTVDIVGPAVLTGKVKAKNGVLISMTYKSKLAFTVSGIDGTTTGTLKSKAVLQPGP